MISRAAARELEISSDAWPRRAQPGVVGAALALLFVGAAWLTPHHGPRQAALFLIGAACGLVLYHSAFGFTSAFRAFIVSGDGRGLRAQMLMLAVATLLFAPILAWGEVLGTPLVGAVAPVGLSVLVGAFLFGIGMQVGGGCGSGTLFHLGGGTTSAALTLLGFIAGSVLATFHLTFWWTLETTDVISLGERLGWPEAVGLQLVLFGLIAWLLRKIERRRLGVVPPMPVVPGGWRCFIHGPWPLPAGGVALALLNALTLVVAGHPWAITWAFTLSGGKVLQALGYDLSAVPFWTGEFQRAALDGPILSDVTSVMDLGLILGALLGAGLAGRFAPARRIPLRIVTASLLGGFLLGYGARLAYGCNISGYFSAIASTSLHGWLWFAAALLGTPLGVRLRTTFGVGRDITEAPAC